MINLSKTSISPPRPICLYIQVTNILIPKQETQMIHFYGSGQPTGTVQYFGTSYFPSGPLDHPTKLDAHYWENMFRELGFGESVDPRTLPTAVPADISAPMPHYMENSDRQQISHQQQQHIMSYNHKDNYVIMGPDNKQERFSILVLVTSRSDSIIQPNLMHIIGKICFVYLVLRRMSTRILCPPPFQLTSPPQCRTIGKTLIVSRLVISNDNHHRFHVKVNSLFSKAQESFLITCLPFPSISISLKIFF